MEESDVIKNAKQLFKKAEAHIESGNYQKSIQVFGAAIHSFTEAQELYLDIKRLLQPKISELKKEIKSKGLTKKYTAEINSIESLKNNFQINAALKTISKLKKKLPKKSLTKPTKKTLPKIEKATIPPPKEKVKETTAAPTSTKELPQKPTITELQKETPGEVPEETSKEALLLEQELKFENNENYYGQTLNNKISGKGRYYYSNGNAYDGQWQNEQFHGEGSYTFYFGDKFVGQWQNGQRHGIGTYTWKNGQSLKAKWQKNKPDGAAYFYNPGKPKQKVFLKDGSLTSTQASYKYSYKNDELIQRAANNRLNKKQQRIYEFSKKIQLSLQDLHLKNNKLLKPDLPLQAYLHQRYFSGLMSERDMKQAETAIKHDFFTMKRYTLISNNRLENEDDEPVVGILDGYSIPTAKLGVVLDTSGSMFKYIEPLKKQINENFPNAAFIEVKSCRLTTYSTGNISEKAADDSTMNAIKFLIDNKGVDSIYWFSDLNGTRAPEAISQLNKWLDKSMVALYVRSVTKKPDKVLIKLIEQSGGKYLKK